MANNNNYVFENLPVQGVKEEVKVKKILKFIQYVRVPVGTCIVKEGVFGKVRVKSSGIKFMLPTTDFKILDNKVFTLNPPMTQMECSDKLYANLDLSIDVRIDDPQKYYGADPDESVTNPEAYLLNEIGKAVTGFVKTVTYEELETIFKKQNSQPLSDYGFQSGANGETISNGIFNQVIDRIRNRTGIQVLNFSIQRLVAPKAIKDAAEHQAVSAKNNETKFREAANQNKIAEEQAQSRLRVADYEAQAEAVRAQSQLNVTKQLIEELTDKLIAKGFNLQQTMQMLQAFNRNPNVRTLNLINNNNGVNNNDLMLAIMASSNMKDNCQNPQNSQMNTYGSQSYNYVEDNSGPLLESDGEYRSRRR